MSKRSSVAATSVAKRGKSDPVAQKCKDVVKVLVDADALDDSEETRQMMIDLVPNCLAIGKEERHKYQTEGIAMIGSVLDQVENGLKQAITEAETGMADAEKHRADCEASVPVAEGKLAPAADAMKQAKHGLAEAALHFRKTRDAVEEAQKEEKKGNVNLTATSKKKDELDAALKDMDKVYDTEPKVRNYLARLAKFITWDDSLKEVLPPALGKAAATRTDFDQMVIDRLKKLGATKATEFDQVIQGAEPARAAFAAQVQAAEAAFAAAQDKQGQMAAAFTAARDGAAEFETQAEQARKSVGVAKRKVGTAKRALDDAQAHLDIFREGAQASFVALRDGTADDEAAVDAEA